MPDVASLALGLLFLLLLYGLFSRWNRRRQWRNQTLIFVSASALVKGRLFGRRLPKGYAPAVRFFHAPLLDRTGTLDHGFRFQPLSRVPEGEGTVASDIGVLCDQRGRQLLAEARTLRRRLQVAWSGGIDSTAGLCALLRACEDEADLKCLEVLLTPASIEEYPWFFETRIRQRLGHVLVTGTIASRFNPDALIVTGEMGDQLFGSLIALPLVETGEAFEPWREALLRALRRSLRSRRQAKAALRYLLPAIEAAPVPLVTLFDALWWLNFALKWQAVDLRLAVDRGREVEAVHRAMRHFYATEAFQRWSLAHLDRRIRGRDLATYKWPLKDYILACTGDAAYHRTKRKVPSLRPPGSRSGTPQSGAVRALAADYSLYTWSSWSKGGSDGG